MAKKKKYYVVWEGMTPGIYDSWVQCQLQIKGYPGAKYKSFTSLAEAEEAFKGAYFFSPKKKKRSPAIALLKDKINLKSICVDAACSGNPGMLEYRGVNTANSDEIFRMGPFQGGTNNIGEFLALVHGLAYLHQIKDEESIIYSDSRTAIKWVKLKKANTTVKKSKTNQKIFRLIERAENWLKTHRFETEIVKWPTGEWGEIPADFGRK
jgi:ribonuclease HI